MAARLPIAPPAGSATLVGRGGRVAPHWDGAVLDQPQQYHGRTAPQAALGHTFAGRWWLVLAAVLAALACGSEGDGAQTDAQSADATASAADTSSDSGADAKPADGASSAGSGDSLGQWQPKPPTVLELAPPEGPSLGMNLVTLSGFDLDETVQVAFGESPGLDLQVLDDQTVQVTAPPRSPGLVDVTVVAAGRPELVLPGAYRYTAEVAVQSVQPAQGPCGGGTPVAVTGKGFGPKTKFYFGTREALQIVVVDDHTAMVLAPANGPGPVNVTALDADGQGVLKGAFVYRQAPTLSQVSPATAGLGAAPQVVLTGTGLSSSGGVVQWLQGKTTLSAQILGSSGGGTQLVVSAPTVATKGAWGVRYTNQDGSAELKGAFHYVDSQQGAEILGVSPSELPANALTSVAIAVSGPISASLAQKAVVRFGGQAVKVLQALPGPAGQGLGATFLVVPPAPATSWAALPATVAVEVELGTATLEKDKGFTYLVAQPQVTSVTPAMLPPQGGSLVQVNLSATQGHGKATQLRIGALQAAQVLSSASVSPGSDLTVQGIAPAGSVGPADVTVRLADGSQAVLVGGVQYVPTDVSLQGLLPGKGAQAGGTWVTLVGGGLSKIKAVWLGSASVKGFQLLHDGALRFKTPPGVPGPAALQVQLLSGELRTLAKAFVFFDPISADNGTWGEAIDGAVNVTVLKKGKIGPVPGALVMVGDDPKTPLQGLTDAKGQVTLSAPGLTGPVHVHATKAGWSAASVVAVNVENITIRLQEFPPAAAGSGSGAGTADPPPLPSYITGTVVDADKYTIFPMGSCKNEPSVASQCKPCSTALDCLAGTVCEEVAPPLVTGTMAAAFPLTTTQKFCLLPCTAASDCQAGYECRAVGQDMTKVQFRCTPRIGTPQVRCEGATGSIFGYPLPSPKEGIADSKGQFTVRVTPGDSAIVCRSGYVDKYTGEFVPLTMGMARRLFSIPGQQQDGVVVQIQVPLDRTMRVRMDRIPMGIEATGLRQMTAGISLGSEGYLATGQVTTYAQTDTMEFDHQPAPSLWAGENGDLRYELYGGLSQAYGASPNTTSQATHIDPRGLDRMAWLAPGAAKAAAAGAPLGSVSSVDSAGELRVAVGDSGTILHWTGGNFTPQPSPTSAHLRAVWLAPDGKGDGWAGGASGVLLRKTSLGWQGWPQQAPRTVVAIAGRTGSDAWLVDDQSQLMHWNGGYWAAQSGPWPVSEPPKNKWDPTPPAKQVQAMWHSPQGTLWLVGDQGALLSGQLQLPATLPDQVTPAATMVFQAKPAPTWLTLRSVWGTSDSDVWIAGDRGYLAHWNGQKWQAIPTGATQALWAVRGTGAGQPVEAVGGQGTWLRIHPSGEVQDLSASDLRVDLRGWLPTFDGGRIAAGQPVLVIGPYLEYPKLTLPVPGQPISGPGGAQQVTWTAQPGLDPTLNIVRIADYSYQTRWELFVKGTVTAVDLPDFAAMGASSPLPQGTAYVRLWRVYAPGLTVDAFSSKLLSSWAWISWAYAVRSTEEPNLIGAPNYQPQMLPSPSPKPGYDPPWKPK